MPLPRASGCSPDGASHGPASIDGAGATGPVARSFSLVLACCADAAGVVPRGAAILHEASFDASALVQLARWHRVLPFMHDFIGASRIGLPPDQARILAIEARAARMSAIANAAEEARIATAACDVALDVLFLKGATLGHLLYDDPFAKSSWDIDVLVERRDIRPACALLREMGYLLDTPTGITQGRRFQRWFDAMRETTWRHPRLGTVVELHVGLSETPSVLAGVGMDSPRQMVSINGVDVPTLATDELFAFLCVHGATHGWARLKWLVDVAALIQRSDRSVTDLREAAIRVGAGRCGDAALLLCHQLLGLALPAALVATMERDRATRGILEYSLGLIDHVGDENRRLAAETVPQILASIRNQHRFAPGIRAGLRTLWANWKKPYGTGQLWVPGALLPIVMIVWLPVRLLLRPFRRKRA